MNRGPVEADTQFSDVIDVTAGGSGLGPTRDRLRDWLRAAGVPERELHEILIATGEACTNAVEHSGATGGPAGPAAWIEATCEEETIRIVIADRGRWKEPDPERARRERRGRGRLMMTELMDVVDIGTDATGTTVRLSRNRGKQPPNATPR